MNDPYLKTALVQIFHVVLSLSSSYFIFRFLKGTVKINHKGVQLTGSAAMFVVVMYVLNMQFQQVSKQINNDVGTTVLIENKEGSIEEVDKLFISTKNHLVSERELNRLDKNQFYVDDQLLLALPLATNSSWIIEDRTDIPVISEYDLPFTRIGISVGGGLFVPDTTFTVKAFRRSEGHKIELLKSSKYNGLPIDQNPYRNENFRNGLLEMFSNSASMFSNPEEPNPMEGMLTGLMGMAFEMVTPMFDSLIENSFPFEKEIYSGLYVMPIENVDELTSDMNKDFMPEQSLLTMAIDFVASQPSAGIVSFENLYINQNEKIASFDGSAELEDVLVNGKIKDIRINNVGFILAGENRAIFVQLIYLSNDTINHYEELKRALNQTIFAS